MAIRILSLYRYQILPIDVQPNLLFDLEKLIQKKNFYFQEAVLNLKISGKDENKRRYSYELVRYIESKIMMITSRQKKVKYIREDHTEDKIASFPFVHLIFDNDKDYQILAVENKSDYKPATIVNLLEKTLQNYLKKDNLTVKFSPIYRENDFWLYLEKNKNNISSVTFSIITPNMSNISSRLCDDIKTTAKMTGAAVTDLKLSADKNGSLHIDQGNTMLDGIIDYTSQGGGEISAQSKKSKLSFSSNDFQLTIEVSEEFLKECLPNIIEIIREKAHVGDSR